MPQWTHLNHNHGSIRHIHEWELIWGHGPEDSYWAIYSRMYEEYNRSTRVSFRQQSCFQPENEFRFTEGFGGPLLGAGM